MGALHEDEHRGAGTPRRAGRGAGVALALVLLYVTVRSLVLYTSFDDTCLPNFELALMGNLAKVVQLGWAGPPLAQYYDNCGGHLVTGFLGGVSFALFGDSYLALKLVSLAFGVATLLLTWRIADRYYGRRAALVAAALFALPVPTLAKYSMLAKGNHFETLFFQLLAFGAFLRMHERGVARAPALAFGLASGFAVFAYFGSVALLVSMAFAHVLARGVRASLRDAGSILPGFVVGAAPLGAVVALGGSGAPAFLHAKLTQVLHRSPAEALERLRSFAAEILPRAAGFERVGPLPGVALDGLFLAVFAAAWVTLALHLARTLAADRRSPVASAATVRVVPLLSYLPVVGLAVALSSFEFTAYAPPLQVGRFRYLVPYIALAGLTIGAAHASLSGVGRRASALALATVLLATGAAWAGLVDWRFEHTGGGPRYDGYLFRHYGVAMGRPQRDSEGRLGWDRQRIVAQLSTLPPEHRHQAYATVGYWVAWSLARSRKDEPSRVPDLLTEGLASFPPEHHVDLARGMGSYLRAPTTPLAVERSEWLEALLEAGAPLAEYVAEGLCLDPQLTLSRLLGTREQRCLELAEDVPPPLHGAWARGRGLACGRVLRRGAPADVAAIRKMTADLPLAERRDFWFGVGCAWGERGEAPSGLVRRVPPAYREQALLGYGAEARHVFGPSVELGLAALPPSQRASAQRGRAWPDYPAPYRL